MYMKCDLYLCWYSFGSWLRMKTTVIEYRCSVLFMSAIIFRPHSSNYMKPGIEQLHLHLRKHNVWETSAKNLTSHPPNVGAGNNTFKSTIRVSTRKGCPISWYQKCLQIQMKMLLVVVLWSFLTRCSKIGVTPTGGRTNYTHYLLMHKYIYFVNMWLWSNKLCLTYVKSPFSKVNPLQKKCHFLHSTVSLVRS